MERLPRLADIEEQSSLLNIPPEIRVRIWECLNPLDIVSLRLLSKHLRDEVEEHIDFCFRLDQSFRGFRKLCRLRIKSCRIIKLTHQNLPQGSLFLFPDKLKRFTLDGGISQPNLHKILTHCKDIEELVITHQTMGISNLFNCERIEACLRNNLSHLTKLDIQLLRHPHGDPFSPEKNMNAVFSIHFPSLRCFKLYFSLWGDYTGLIGFLAKHVGTLQELDLHLGDGGDEKNTRLFLRLHPRNPNLNVLMEGKALKGLKLTTLQFRDDVLNLNPQVGSLLMEMLESQRTLKSCRFHSPGDLSIGSLQTAVACNEKTLVNVSIFNLKIPNANQGQQNNNNAVVNSRYPVDMSLFQKCCKLKTLTLSCTTSLENGVETSNLRLTKLHMIPNSLEKVHISGFQLDLQDIVLLSQNSNRLKELVIADAGIMKYSTALASVLKNCAHLDYFHVRPVVTRANGDVGWYNEVEQLTKLYHHFMGVGFDPIDDLDGFEARISDKDRQWVKDNVIITEF